MMKIAVVSMAVDPGNCHANVRLMKQYIISAEKKQADLIVFPQNAVTGYPLGDRWLDKDFCSYADRWNEEIAAMANKIAIVWGNVRYRGNRCFNCAFFAYQQHLEIRVKGYEGTICNDARYFDSMENAELIEYQNELIALNFHDELQLATMNITLDATQHSIDPKGATQVYVNTGGFWQDDRGVHLFDGRCFVTKGHKVLHFSEYVEGLHICTEEQSMEVSLAGQQKRLACLFDALEQKIGKFTLMNDPFSKNVSMIYHRPWLWKTDIGLPVFQTVDWGKRKSSFTLLADFTPAQLLEAKVIRSLDELTLEALIIAYYEETNSIDGICLRLFQNRNLSHQIDELLKDLGTAEETIVKTWIQFQRINLSNEIDEKYIQYLRAVIRENLQKRMLMMTNNSM